jgi:hypothetical protein
MVVQAGQASGDTAPRKYFTKLQARLQEGRLSPGPTARRYLPEESAKPHLSWQAVSELGNQRGAPTGLRRVRFAG